MNASLPELNVYVDLSVKNAVTNIVVIEARLLYVYLRC